LMLLGSVTYCSQNPKTPNSKLHYNLRKIMARPPKPIAQQRATMIIPEDFDKNAWLKDLKALAKDANIEERDRFRPLIKMKNDSKEILEELEKLEKKYEIALMRERDQLR